MPGTPERRNKISRAVQRHRSDIARAQYAAMGFPDLTPAQEAAYEERERQEKIEHIKRKKEEHAFLTNILEKPNAAGKSPSPTEQMQRINNELTGVRAEIDSQMQHGELLDTIDLSAKENLLIVFGRHIQAAYPETAEAEKLLDDRDPLLAPLAAERRRVARKETYEQVLTIIGSDTLSDEEKWRKLEVVGKDEFQDVFRERSEAAHNNLPGEELALLELKKNNLVERVDFASTVADLIHANAIDENNPQQLERYSISAY